MAAERSDELQDRVIVITGGNAGIGKETAVGLAAKGADVVITARDAGRGAGRPGRDP